MFLDFSKIRLRTDGTPEEPTLVLKSLDERTIGVVSNAYNVKFEINLSDLSTIEFTVPYMTDGVVNPLYKQIDGYKVIHTEAYGVYVLMRPQTTGDGIKEVKAVTGYSLEYLGEKKRMFLEEGTYNFWNPVLPDDTILGRVLEVYQGWSIGYVDPSLVGMYRTFDQYDADALKFCYSDAMDKFQCVIVFDVYEKTISAYNANESRGNLPIYLSYENLVKSVDVSELTDEIVTKLHVYGADDLSIAGVNPAGTDAIIDLSYFIGRGELNVKVGDSTQTLAEKYENWQHELLNRQEYYTGLVSARVSAMTQKLILQVELAELDGELETIKIQQNVTIQALAMETTDAGKKARGEELSIYKQQYDAKQAEINAKKLEVEEVDAQIAGYTADIVAVNNELGFDNYFTPDELLVLDKFLIESDFVEETFVASDVDASVDGVSSSIEGNVSVSGAEIVRISLDEPYNKVMYTVAGGDITVEAANLTAKVIRGTLETRNADSSFVLSLYLGTIEYSGSSFDSGLLTMQSLLSGMTDDIAAVTENEITEHKGTTMSFSVAKLDTTKPNAFFSVNTNEYQKYTVAKELYDFGAKALADMATPTYEFSLDSTNFLFMEEFTPFKNKLELGKGLYLNLASEGTITANAIGLVVDFSNRSSLSMTFSNRYKKKNGYKTLEKMLKGTYSSSRSFDASKYTYGKTVGQMSNVTNYMNSMFDASKQTIVGAQNQTVVIDGAGINVGGTSNDQLRIIDSMIAMTDDGWQTSKLAIGRFQSEELGEQWGINVGLLAGKLIIGNNLVMENETENGVVQFRFDSTGAWLNNSTFVLQKDNGGKIIIDPEYGIVAGEGDLFTTNGTTVTPSFVDEDGNMVTDEEGFPENANFYLDLRDGTAYFRGTVKATSGSVGGWTIAENQLYSGSGDTFVALNSSKDEDSLYAIWAGDEEPSAASFYVKRDGTVYAKNGTFGGRIEATEGNFSGTLNAVSVGGNIASKNDVMDSTHYSQYDNQSGWLLGCGIDIGNGKFKVDQQGNVHMTGAITWGDDIKNDLVDSVTESIEIPPGTYALYHRGSNGTPSKPTGTYDSYSASSTTSWHKTYNANDKYVSYSTDGGSTWGPSTLIRGVEELPDYIKSTYIDETDICGPRIYGGHYFATGEGRLSGAAYYITDGFSIYDPGGEGVAPGDPLGWLSWDSEDGVGRVILRSTMNPLKLQAGTNMSLQAGINWNTGTTDKYAKIYIQNPIVMTTGTMFGTVTQRDAVKNPVGGQLFFVLG